MFQKTISVAKWIKNHVWETVASFCAGLAVIFGLAFLVQRIITRDETRIARVKTAIKELHSKRNIMTKENDLDILELKELEKETAVLKDEIIAARDTAGMTDDEVMAAFAALGY